MRATGVGLRRLLPVFTRRQDFVAERPLDAHRLVRLRERVVRLLRIPLRVRGREVLLVRGGRLLRQFQVGLRVRELFHPVRDGGVVHRALERVVRLGHLPLRVLDR